jgi:hypothetical protein
VEAIRVVGVIRARVVAEASRAVEASKVVVEESKVVAEAARGDAIRADAEDHHSMLFSSSRSDAISQMIAIHSKYTHY